MLSGTPSRLLWIVFAVAMLLVPRPVSAQEDDVYVTSNGSGGSKWANTGGHQVEFTIEYINSLDEGGEVEFDLNCWGSSGISCQVTSSIMLAEGFPQNVTVTFSTGSSTGSASVFLRASNSQLGFSDSAAQPYTIVQMVTVTDVYAPDSVPQYNVGDTAIFNVKNETSGRTFTFTCSWAPDTCTPSPTSAFVSTGANRKVKVTFDAGNVAQTKPLKLTATHTGTGSWHSDQRNVKVWDIGASDGVYVTANTGTPSEPLIGTSYGLEFSVLYVDSNWDGSEVAFDMTCNRSGTVASCQSPGDLMLAHAIPQEVTVQFDAANATGLGTLFLEAKNTALGFVDEGSRTFDVERIVHVTADSIAASVPQYGANREARFRVQNDGSVQRSYVFACRWKGVACTAEPVSANIPAGQDTIVKAEFDAGSTASTYALELEATASGVSDTHSANVEVWEVTLEDGVHITPGSVPDTIFTHSAGHQVDFSVMYVNSQDDGSEVAFEMTCRDNGTATCSNPGDLMLAHGFPQDVTVNFHADSATGTGQFWLKAVSTAPAFQDEATAIFTVASPVLVTPDSIPSSVLQYSEGNTARFHVKNLGPSDTLVVMTCTWATATCTPSPQQVSIARGATETVTLTFDGGDVPSSYGLELTATVGPSFDSSSGTVTVAEYAPVTVTPARTPIYAPPNATLQKDTFALRFPGQSAASVDLNLVCPGGTTQVRSCSDPGLVSVGDTEVLVEFTYTAGAQGDTSTVTLTATHQTQPEITASATMDVIATSQMIVTVDDANPGLELLRSECVQIAAGPGASVCDDFQYVYPFTPVMRLNRTRQTGLIYNTALRMNWGVIGVNVVLPPAVPEPTKLQATLVLAGQRVDSTTFGSSLYDPGLKTRLALDFAEVVAGTKLLPYTVELVPWVGGAPGTPVSVSGHFISLDKRYVFGNGWWLAGYEELVTDLPADSTLGNVLLWVGGDASTRVYVEEAAGIYVGLSRAHPDTIIDGGTSYTRKLLGGGQVIFDVDGKHQKTIDRNGNETIFSHASINGYERPTSIALPTPTGADTIYALDYHVSEGWLEAVRVRSADGTGWDTFKITTDSLSSSTYWISSIETPDSVKTSFRGHGAGQLDTIFGPRGDTTTISYHYRKPWQVTQITEDLPNIVHWFQAGSLVGLDTTGYRVPRPADEVYTRRDGPLSGTVDHTDFYLTGWGALRGIEDALGNQTWIEREDPAYPGLPTSVRHPNGWEVTASYNVLGLPDTIVDHATGAIASYEWNTKWRQPMEIMSSTGVVTQFTYDPSTGNRLTQQVVGSGTTTYKYDTDGLVRSIRNGLNHRDTLVYDTRGNLERQLNPLGHRTRYVRDHLGRVTTTVAPDSMTKTVMYDVMGRVTVEETKNPIVDALWTRVHTVYDSVGQRIKVQAYGDTTATPQDSLTTGPQEWGYDQLGRVTWKRQGSKSDTTYYDLAGRVTELRTDRGHVITMAYDSLGRLEQRIVPAVTYGSTAGVIDSLPYYSSGLTIPADTVRFTYDELGNPLTINNRYAHITRTYTLNGHLATEQQAIMNYPSGVFTTHVYDLAYIYDLDGRRVRLQHPTWLGGGTDQTAYGYDTVGRIATITGPLGGTFTYAYDAADRVEKRTFPAGEAQWEYDNADRLTAHRIVIGADTVLSNTIGRDAMGRVTSIGGDGSGDVDYGGLGGVTSSTDLAWEGPLNNEEFVMDPFGAQLRRVSIGGELGQDSVAFRNNINIYGRIVGTTEEWAATQPDPNTPPTDWQPGWNSFSYDASGNRSRTRQERYVWHISGAAMGDADKLVAYQEETKSYYSADQRLMVHQANRDSIRYDTIWATETEEGRWGTYEEYWYDGLGRRILKRTREDDPQQAGSHCEIADRCYSSIERIVWDGQQVLWEIRQPDAGNVKDPSGGAQTGSIGYVHAGDIDAPLAMMRNGGLIVPHQNWRGLYAFSTDDQGAYTTCTPAGGGGCTSIAWPAGNGTTFMINDAKKTQYWYGSLVMGQRDATGLSYRRNRYYDPVTGLFTQQDPIGIAGGLNLYGYANGDPINFSDPFGLCPHCTHGDRVRYPDPFYAIGGSIGSTKAGVGIANMGIGLAKVTVGAGMVTAGTETAPFLFGAMTLPAYAVGGYNITSGVASFNRGAQQLAEGLSDARDTGTGALRNFLGLLPFGQKFDDVAEPTPIEYAQTMGNSLKEDFWGTVTQIVIDFFSFER